MVKHEKTVGVDSYYAEYGPIVLIADYKLHYNMEIIKRFIDEGKIGQLNPYSSNHHSTLNP
jgi:hypothetical protein